MGKKIKKKFIIIIPVLILLFTLPCSLPGKIPTETPAVTRLPKGTLFPRTATPNPGIPPKTPASEKIPVLLSDDGSPDGAAALLYLVMSHAVDLQGVLVTNGEAHPSRAVAKWGAYLGGVLSRPDVLVVPGCECAVDPNPHEFPGGWRDAADNFWGMPLPAYDWIPAAVDGVTFISDFINRNPKKGVILVTGSQTDLAMAFQRDPGLISKVGKVVLMGGAVNVLGNVAIEGGDMNNPFAEWNIWIDAQAAAGVFASGVPVWVVPLDATNEVLVRRDFQEQIAASSKSEVAFITELWGNQFGWFNTDQLIIWDLTAAVAVDHPELFTWQASPLSVVTTRGNEQGRTVAGAGVSPTTRYADHANVKAVLDQIQETFGN